MSLVSKTSPAGVDYHIDKLQKYLYQKITGAWQGVVYESYPRCYRNKKEQGYVAEVFKGNNEYSDLLWDDTKDVVSFFGLGEDITIELFNTVDVHLIFFLNLEKVKPDAAFRKDEEVRQEIQAFLGKAIFNFQLTDIELYFDNVLKEYNGTRKSNFAVIADMHPLYALRFNFSLQYNPAQNC